MIPSFVLSLWLSGVVAAGLIAGSALLAHEWYQHSWYWDEVTLTSVFQPAWGMNSATAIFAAATLLGLLVIAGRPMVLALLRRAQPVREVGASDPRHSLPPASVHELARPDGTILRVECFGPEHGRPIVCTHGWGLTGHEWNYLKRQIPDGHRLIVWDLPGLGNSSKPRDRDFSLVKLAADLAAVVEFAGKSPLLVGHSIGGMIVLTYMGFTPRDAKPIRGLVLVHTTPTNPVRTTAGASILSAIEKPVLVPLLYLTIALSPLFRLLNWLAFMNGTTHLQAWRGSFGGTETWQEVDFAARFQPRASPAVLARGMLAMLRYDALATLSAIRVPTLVISADRDSTTKPTASAAINAGIAASDILKLSPAKHLGLIEHHHAFNRAVADMAGR